MARWIVCGSRHLTEADYTTVAHWLLEVAEIERGCDLLLHGGARGADSLAVEWAETRSLGTKCYPADWKKHGRRAGPLRNQEMLENVVHHTAIVVAFPLVGAENRGTWDMIKRAAKAGVRVVIYPIHHDEEE